MPIESPVNFISDLVRTNPTESDPRSEGDDHFRLIKGAILDTFTGITGAVTVTHGELNSLASITGNVQDQINLAALKGGDTYTGTHNFTGGVVNVATQGVLDSSTLAASTAFVQSIATLATYPDPTGQSGKVLSNNGSVAQWIENEDTVPVGTIVAFLPGYFGDGSNGTFTPGITNSIAAVNTLLNPQWYACDGAELNDPQSDYFNGAGRYLPNLTDDRFLMGDLTMGGIGGSNSMLHTHDISHLHTGQTTDGHALTVSEMPAHTHGFNEGLTYLLSGTAASNTVADTASFELDLKSIDDVTTTSQGGNSQHSHNFDTSLQAFVSGGASNGENRPTFLSVIYIIKVRSS